MRERLRSFLEDYDSGVVDWQRLQQFLEVRHTPKAYRPPVHRHGTHVAGIIGADWRTTDEEVGLPGPREDMAGIVAYNAMGAGGDWVHKLAPVGDKKAILASIDQMVMGDTPSLQAHLQDAYDALSACDAAQKHVIVISDGDPQSPTSQLLSQCKDAGITVSTVAVYPHDPSHVNSLIRVAQLTGGRFYHAQDPAELPHIFIKEAQVVRRPLIWEETFTPQVRFGLSELLKGVNGLPPLDGYVLSGPKEGLAQLVLVSEQGDPVLATCQSGLGRCVVFTSSVDTRWGTPWRPTIAAATARPWRPAWRPWRAFRPGGESWL